MSQTLISIVMALAVIVGTVMPALHTEAGTEPHQYFAPDGKSYIYQLDESG